MPVIPAFGGRKDRNPKGVTMPSGRQSVYEGDGVEGTLDGNSEGNLDQGS